MVTVGVVRPRVDDGIAMDREEREDEDRREEDHGDEEVSGGRRG